MALTHNMTSGTLRELGDASPDRRMGCEAATVRGQVARTAVRSPRTRGQRPALDGYAYLALAVLAFWHVRDEHPSTY